MTLFLFSLMLINMIFAMALIFIERKNPSVTWAWLMILFFLPGVGFVLYLFIGQNLRRQNIFERKSDQEYIIDDFVTKQVELLNNVKAPLNQQGMENHLDFVRFNLTSNRSVYTENNEVEFFNDGNDKFARMLDDITNAKSFVHVQYYIIRNDNLGKRFVSLLAQKAQEGVEVKVLCDGMGCLRLPKNFFDELKKAGGKVCIFFPAYLPYINVRINYRNHRKICIIDGMIGYIGGFNIGDEYLGLDKNFGYWRDAHIRIVGGAIASLQIRFFMDWRFASNETIAFSSIYFPPHPDIKNAIGMQIMSSGPDTTSSAIKNMYFKMINEAEKTVYIQTPYFVPDDSIAEALKVAALSGIDVRVIIPSIPDHPFIYWVNRSYAGALLSSGVKFYYFNNGFVHSKEILVDGIIASVGTANMDIRSFETNFEVNAVIYNKKFVGELQSHFIKDLERCTELTKEIYANRGIVSNIKESISRLLAPLL